MKTIEKIELELELMELELLLNKSCFGRRVR